nr:MAG TPA: hypothetical protein [Caudoviricetes sp.]
MQRRLPITFLQSKRRSKMRKVFRNFDYSRKADQTKISLLTSKNTKIRFLSLVFRYPIPSSMILSSEIR